MAATAPAPAAHPVDRGAAPAPRPFTVDEYYRMAEAGILGPEERVELVDGAVLVMSPIGSRHAAAVRRLDDLFRSRLGPRTSVSVQNPILLDDHSEPQPDLALLLPRADHYAAGHPGPADVFLVVEVMDSSASYDRTAKLPLYARSGVGEAWLVDLERQAVEAYRRPGPGGYAEVAVHARGQALAPGAFPDAPIEVDAILG